MQVIRSVPPSLELPKILEKLLPKPITDAVKRCGASHAEELRLHADRISTVCTGGRSFPLRILLHREDLASLLKDLCHGSLYAYNHTICQGYLALEGGVRIGVCGRAATENGAVIGVSEISGLIIRIPHAVSVSARPLLERIFLDPSRPCGMLLYAPPGIGKTTLLRALAKEISSPPYSIRTVVVDTREELSFTLDGADMNLDILQGYPRRLGIEIAFRSLGAQLILCDEIGDTADASAILSAAGCGVPLVASVHASTVKEVLLRPLMQQLHRAHVFPFYAGIRRDAGNEMHYIFTERSEADGLLPRLR
ncbi:MAG: AAA family ATPase [Clostridia bacterium]|nr:AAA family ATPase [Clostridia bacterium]